MDANKNLKHSTSFKSPKPSQKTMPNQKSSNVLPNQMLSTQHRPPYQHQPVQQQLPIHQQLHPFPQMHPYYERPQNVLNFRPPFQQFPAVFQVPAQQFPFPPIYRQQNPVGYQQHQQQYVICLYKYIFLNNVYFISFLKDSSTNNKNFSTQVRFRYSLVW